MINNLKICKQTREIAAQTLYTALKKLLESEKPISELMLRDEWLKELRKHDNIFPDGWYMPPPHGIAVLFSNENDFTRINHKSLRPQEKWSRENIYLNRQNGILYLFAGPVDRRSGIIGDFQITLYLGNNVEIKELLKTCFLMDKQIFEYANVGMKLSQIATYANTLMKQKGMITEIISKTDITGINNIGHTIPVPVNEWTSDEQAEFIKGSVNWQKIKEIINHKRIFTNTNENYILKPGGALTIEPRPKYIKKRHLPSSISFHTIALFKENGEKELLTDFDELFRLVGMNYMLKK